MTILATTAIRAALTSGAIVCDPAPARVEGAHIDVTLGAHYWEFDISDLRPGFDLADTDPWYAFIQINAEKSQRILIPPRGFILAHTAEYIGTAPGSGLIPCLHTRSTLARWGLSVCTANAGFGDEGYTSRWTLEIVNPHPVAVAIPVGARVGCITFQRLEGVAQPYETSTRYNAQPGEWSPTQMLPRKGNW